jgi:RNA polymerase II-associated protein 2
MDEKILKRLEYEKKAQKIVERLAEETVDAATFNSLANLIEPYHYEEIVEERFLGQTCGYPVCSNVLKDIPKQKYQISIKTNKVYDITYRLVSASQK